MVVCPLTLVWERRLHRLPDRILQELSGQCVKGMLWVVVSIKSYRHIGLCGQCVKLSITKRLPGHDCSAYTRKPFSRRVAWCNWHAPLCLSLSQTCLQLQTCHHTQAHVYVCTGYSQYISHTTTTISGFCLHHWLSMLNRLTRVPIALVWNT